jgi:3-phenylpropionate/cinnamic acid dioxygenase small subunit
MASDGDARTTDTVTPELERAVERFITMEAALLDEWRLDEWQNSLPTMAATRSLTA